MAIDSLGAPPRTAPQEPPPPLNRHLCQGNPFLSQEPFPARNTERSIVCETAKEPFCAVKTHSDGKNTAHNSRHICTALWAQETGEPQDNKDSGPALGS